MYTAEVIQENEGSGECEQTMVVLINSHNVIALVHTYALSIFNTKYYLTYVKYAYVYCHHNMVNIYIGIYMSSVCVKSYIIISVVALYCFSC